MGEIVRRILAHRLFQFAFAGVLLYGVARAREKRVVEIDASVLGELHAAQEKKLGVPALSEDGKREVDARAIEDEILYREALRLGLDRDDPIVKQRLAQKLLLLVEDLGGASSAPTNAELRAHLAAHPERFTLAPSYRLTHVFAAKADAVPPAKVFVGDAIPEAGEAFPYTRATTATRADLAKLFGDEFATATAALAPGETSAPVRSPFGWHRVHLVERIEGHLPTLEEVKSDVTIDLLLERRENAVGTFLTQTASAYDIRVGGKKIEGFVPTRRVAARNEGSAED